MDTVLQILMLTAGLALLVKGADFFVAGSSELAAKFGIPQLIIGLTVVAMGTSLPEAAVSISGVIKGNSDITVGNVLGSNILNVLIILGLSSVIAPLAVGASTVRHELPFLAAVTVLLLVQGLDGAVGPADAVVLTVLFALYLVYLIITAKRNPEKTTVSSCKTENRPRYMLLKIFFGLAMTIAGSSISVDAASAIALTMGMSERFVGLTVVALGTSLPELFTSLTAAIRKKSDIAVGNIVGSNIFNILFVIGVSALIKPVTFSEGFIFDCVFALISVLLLLLFCIKGKTLGRFNGAVMLAGYAVYFALIL